MSITQPRPAIVGQPEVVEDASRAEHSEAWALLKSSVLALRELQQHDGALAAYSPTPDADAEAARGHVAGIVSVPASVTRVVASFGAAPTAKLWSRLCAGS